MINYLLSAIVFLITSFYSFQFQDIDGNTINMSSFQGKKILLVNIATGSSRAKQLEGLQQLQQQFQDSLVIIAFPSNSFGNEPRNDSEIKHFCDSSYHTTFLIASKAQITGQGIQPIFNWLAHKTDNEDIDAVPSTDFQKFLIDKTGHVSAVISANIKPMSSEMIDVITTNY